jgi:Ca-activated chloride channel family protein
MADGVWPVRLILRDDGGHAYREEKTFVIASRPPTLRVKTDRGSYRRGQTVELRAAASETTRTIVARLHGAVPASLRWSPGARTNIGSLRIPADLPAGSWTIAVTAEDFAHNIGNAEVKIEVLP